MFEGMFEIFNEEKDKEDEETEITYPTSSAAAPYSSQKVFVVSIGGSILMNGKPNHETIDRVSNCLNELIRQGFKLVIAVGGGKIARDYVNAARQLGADNFELDELGIAITRANASLLLTAIENAFPTVLTDVKRCKEALAQGKTPIYGGLLPGFTTDTVAALLAEYLKATFVNLSNVDGIFTADPAAFPSARLYHELSYDKLLQIMISNNMRPSQNLVIDLPAVMVLKRSNITAFFLNGHDLQNFKNAVQGLEFRGTIVRPDAGEVLEGEEETSPRPRSRITRKRTARRKAVKRKASKRKSTKRKPAPRYVEEEEIDPDKIRF
jgi:uridylate kinase